MFRYNYTIKGQTYKVGMWTHLAEEEDKITFFFSDQIDLADFTSRADQLILSFTMFRHLGHSRARIIQWTASNLLFRRSRCNNGIRRDPQGDLPESSYLVLGDEKSVPSHSLHCHCQQGWYARAGCAPSLQVCWGDLMPTWIRIGRRWHQRCCHLLASPWSRTSLQEKSSRGRLHEWHSGLAGRH